MSVRILQFGTGRLLRGLCDEIIDRAGGAGAVCAVQSTGTGRVDTLRSMDHAFGVRTCGLRGGREVDETRTVTAIGRALAAERDWDDLLGVARDPDLGVVISNTTEAGLSAEDEDAAARTPVTFPGKLLAVLRARAEAFGCDPARAPVVVPCELVERNGEVLRTSVLELADRFGVDPAVRAWIADEVCFADTLVDRICTEPGDGPPLETVVEPFAQWAIGGSERVRTAAWFEGHGCEVVDDVSPLFVRKVRVLNGAHTALVAIGLMLGHETVGSVMGDGLLSRFVDAVLEREIVPTVEAEGVPGVRAFARDVVDRFGNPFHAHRLEEIERGSAAKVPIRLLPTIRGVLEMGRIPELLCVSLAAHLVRGGVPEDAAATWPAEIRGRVSDARAAIERGGLAQHLDGLV